MATKMVQYLRNIAGINDRWESNSITPSSGYNIVAIGIQTRPGVQVDIQLNNNENASVITIGPTGIYELNLQGIATINSLVFHFSQDDGIIAIVDVLEEGDDA